MTQESENELATNKRNQDEHDEGEDCPTDVGDRADDFTPAWFPLTPTDAASAILRSTWGNLIILTTTHHRRFIKTIHFYEFLAKYVLRKRIL